MNKKTASVLKGAASLMILMYHMQVKNIFTSCGGYFGVGIFYFFSGYNLAFCTKNRSDYTNKFFEKKFVKIFIPFYIMYVIYQTVLHKGFSIFILYHFVYPDFTCNFLWYIKSLIYIYIWYYIIFKVMLKFDKVNYNALGLLTWIIAGICMIPFSQDPNHIFPFAFILGWVFAIKEDKVIEKFKKNYILIVVEIIAILLAHAGAYYMYNNIGIYILSQYSAPCLCGLLCYSIATSFEINNKVLLCFGMVSYELYLSHPIFIRLCEYNSIKMPLYAIVMICGSYIVAYVLHFVMKIIDDKFKLILKY